MAHKLIWDLFNAIKFCRSGSDIQSTRSSGCLSKLQFSYKVYKLCVGLLFDILDKTAEMRWIKVVDVSSRQLALSATDKPTTESLDHTP